MTNKISQDHLELFFGTIRAKGGFNNNPTARQFESAYKRLLVHTQISGPDTGNISNRENLTILTYGSGRNLTVNENKNDLLEDPNNIQFENSIKDNLDSLQLSTELWDLTIYNADVVAYIAGFVVRILRNSIVCSKCLTFLEGHTVIPKQQARKQYGKLVKASEEVIEICKEAEKYFRFYAKVYGIFSSKKVNLITTLTHSTFKRLSPRFLTNFNDHLFDDDLVGGHAFALIKIILKKYFNLRIHHETSKKLELQKKNSIRSILTKTILFRHQ